MISAGQIREILSLYKKHGWNLRRVLLTDNLKTHLAESIDALFAGSEIVSSELDAAWFLRASQSERETWEIRHLSETPYALVEVFDMEDDEEVREERRHEMIEQMKERVINDAPK